MNNTVTESLNNLTANRVQITRLDAWIDEPQVELRGVVKGFIPQCRLVVKFPLLLFRYCL